MTDLKRNSMSLFQLLSAAYCSLWGDLLTSSSFIFIIYVYKELFSVLSSVLLKCPTYWFSSSFIKKLFTVKTSMSQSSYIKHFGI